MNNTKISKTLIANLKHCMDKKNWNANQLSKKSGVSSRSIRYILDEERGASVELIDKLATAFKIETWELLSDNIREELTTYDTNNFYKVPLISSIQAGEPTLITDNSTPDDSEEWIPTLKQYSKSSFALLVKGESMLNPDPHGTSIKEGMIVIIDPETTPNNGDIIAAKYGEGEQEATLKKYIIDLPNHYLEAMNPKYDPIKLTEDWKIIGVVREIINKLR